MIEIVKPLPGYKEVKPFVYAGFFPVSNEDYQALKDAVEKISLSDSALVFDPENSPVLGFGMRIGFLGLLHMDIIRERLEREYDLDMVLTNPSTDGGEKLAVSASEPSFAELMSQTSGMDVYAGKYGGRATRGSHVPQGAEQKESKPRMELTAHEREVDVFSQEMALQSVTPLRKKRHVSRKRKRQVKREQKQVGTALPQEKGVQLCVDDDLCSPVQSEVVQVEDFELQDAQVAQDAVQDAEVLNDENVEVDVEDGTSEKQRNSTQGEDSKNYDISEVFGCRTLESQKAAGMRMTRVLSEKSRHISSSKKSRNRSLFISREVKKSLRQIDAYISKFGQLPELKTYGLKPVVINERVCQFVSYAVSEHLPFLKIDFHDPGSRRLSVELKQWMIGSIEALPGVGCVIPEISCDDGDYGYLYICMRQVGLSLS